jgi:hypothetical protein
MRSFLLSLVFFVFFPCIGQLGGLHTFEFLNLPTSPRIIALGGYPISGYDDDVNNGVNNPSVINEQMLNNIALNYTNYYTDIFYGDVSYCFSVFNYNFLSSIKFIDYGTFVETNEYGQQIGSFSASEYVISLGSHKKINSLFNIGVNSKFVYSVLYDLKSFGLLLDFAGSYKHPNNRLVTSIIVKNIGFQFAPYLTDRESLPFEISIGFSNKLEHVPLRWHFTFQHIETPDLNIAYDSNTYLAQDNLFNSIVKHFVFGAEFFIHRNLTVLLGYNNRRRSEMIIEDRKALVGFSGGICFQINRFKFNFSRASNHFSGPINTFGIITNFTK